MGRFGRGGGTPRVVGFDFTPPPGATPWTESAPAPVAYEPVAPVEQPAAYEPVAYAPPAYPPPAYPPPAYPAPAADPYAAPVATLAPPQPVPGWGTHAAYPPPPAWTPPPPAPGRRLSRQSLRAGASIVLALGLFAGRVALRVMGDDEPGRSDVTLHTPATLGGLPRQPSAAPDLEGEYGPTVAAYGRGTEPTYLLYADPGGEQPAAQTLREFAQGFDPGTVGAPKAMADGVWCATVTYAAVRGGICAWASTASDGVVVRHDKGDLRALAAVTAEARDQVNRG
jgi:hypothetical protein